MLLTKITQKTQKNSNYFCDICDFKTNNKNDYSRHILTPKHCKKSNLTIIEQSLTNNTQIISNFNCTICNKKYKSRVGLWGHKKKCHFENEIIEEKSSIDNSNNSNNNSNLILELVKQNQEFKELMMEQNKYMLELAKNAGHNTNSHNTTNNNKFNLQLFLNETCKDAMNITEFVNSLVLNFEDLENMGHLGYVEGICKIFLRGLRGVEVTKRPFHCSDVKRETMFVKDLAGWEKENSDNEKLTATIKRIAGKNFKQATAWMANHPKAVLETDSHPHMQYMKMMSQCLGGLTAAEDRSNYNKIIKRVAQEVLIDKGKD